MDWDRDHCQRVSGAKNNYNLVPKRFNCQLQRLKNSATREESIWVALAQAGEAGKSRRAVAIETIAVALASSGKPSAPFRDTQPYYERTGIGKSLTGTNHAGAWLHAAQPAQAIRDVQLPDGSTVSAYELDIALKVVALRGSVPSDANLEFRRALSKYGQFQLAQKAQIADIFDELSQPRSPS